VKRSLESFGFLLGPAVNQSVIRIPTPKEVGVSSLHPQVERVMREKIRQNSADHAPYAKGNFEFERLVKGWRGIHPVLDLRLKK
jgi:hypothetical protein